MFRIIVVGHGKFGYGMKKTVEMVLGKQPKIDFFNFEEGKSTKILEEKMKKSINKMGNKKGTLILTDIKGGTPFNISSTISNEIKNIEVIGGCNMPMIIEALDIRESVDLKGALEKIIISAKEEIEAFKIKKIVNINISEDGI
ncbi:MAG: PTS sugar transporter subunit IIA [Fusobacteriaceae bacterium]